MKSFHDSTMYRKRERTQNWSLEEKMYLLELVKSRLDVLENKRIDSASSAMKGLAWQDIHAGFAARFGNDRDAHRVREQWRRMKGQSRTEMLEFAERVRTYGAETANQRRPSALAEEVWKTLELARKLNVFHQTYGPGDEMGSPANLEDDDDDGDDQWKDMDGEVSYLSNHHNAGPDSRVENGSDHSGRRSDRVEDGSNDDEERTHERNPYLGASTSTAKTSGLMNLLRPKVELNDVPELDTSMVPSGLSITAVRVGNSGHKRRAVLELPPSRERESREFRDPRDLRMPGQVPPVLGAWEEKQPAESSYRSSILETKKLEHRRRIEMMEAEHLAKMELLRVEKETAEIRRRIALRDEQNTGTTTSAANTCRSCAAPGGSCDNLTDIRNGDKSEGSNVDNRRPIDCSISRKSVNVDHDNDASSVVTGLSDEISRGSSTPVNIINGGMDEDDNNNGDQVRFVGGLGEPGSGAGKGGGSGGSIREAGGSMGKREAAFEDEYFYKQQKEQLKKLQEVLTEDISFHEEQIKRHQEAIERSKQRVSDLNREHK